MRTGIALAAALIATPAAALVSAPAQVRYISQGGPSPWHKTAVNFATGRELNEATSGISYDSLAKYAIIFFTQDQWATVRLEGVFGCSSEFTVRCIPSLGRMTGRDESGRQWEICTASFC